MHKIKVTLYPNLLITKTWLGNWVLAVVSFCVLDNHDFCLSSSSLLYLSKKQLIRGHWVVSTCALPSDRTEKTSHFQDSLIKRLSSILGDLSCSLPHLRREKPAAKLWAALWRNLCGKTLRAASGQQPVRNEGPQPNIPQGAQSCPQSCKWAGKTILPQLMASEETAAPADSSTATSPEALG